MLGRINGGVSIVLDALDESKPKKELLDWLKILINSPRIFCRLIVTARSEEDIDSALEGWTQAEERVLIQEHQAIEDTSPIDEDTGSMSSRSSSSDRSQLNQESRHTDYSVSDTAPTSFVVDAHPQKERSLDIPTYTTAVSSDLSDDDANSVVSLDDDIRSLAESDTPYGLQKIASERLIDALSGDAEILAFYDQTCTGQQAIEHERFVRNHVKLLKAFFLDVSHEAHDILSKEAAKFLRSHNRRYQISAMIYQRTASTITLDLDQEAHKGDMSKVEDYLSKLVSDEAETGDSDFNSDLQIENDEADYSDSEFDLSSEDDEEEYPKLEATVSFLTSSRAFVAYKARLRRFAGRLPQPEVAFQKALDDEALEDATALLEHEGPAILNCKEHQYLRRLLDSGFDARDVVAHVIESRSWVAADDDWRNFWAQVRIRLLVHADSMSKLTGKTSDTREEAGYPNSKFADLRFRFSDSPLGRRVARILRPAIPKGYTRVEWTCVSIRCINGLVNG